VSGATGTVDVEFEASGSARVEPETGAPDAADGISVSSVDVVLELASRVTEVGKSVAAAAAPV
jgi:hypothetical protein